MKYLVYVVRKQVTNEPFLKFRAPERVKEKIDEKHFRWIPGFKQEDGNTIMLFGRRMVFRDLISVSVSMDDSSFWKDVHGEIILDFTKGGTDGQDAESRGTTKGLETQNRNAGKKSANQKSAGRIKNLAKKEIIR